MQIVLRQIRSWRLLVRDVRIKAPAINLLGKVGIVNLGKSGIFIKLRVRLF